MLPGALTAGEVTTYQTRVTINGIDRPAVHVDLDAQMRSDLPSQMTRSAGSMDRSGTIHWATPADVKHRVVTPFNDFGVWRPQKGDEVIVYQGDGVTEWRRFTGVIDETTGAVGTGMRSTIIADVDPLSEYFGCEPLLARMYPLPGSTRWRWAGLSPMFYVDAALRAGGYHLTEPTKHNSVLQVPLQTSMLPAIGTGAELLTGSGFTTGSNTATSWGAPWGFSMSDILATYRPATSYAPSLAVSISMMIAPNHYGTAYVDVWYGATRLRLMAHADRSVAVRRENSTGWVTVGTLSAQQMLGATRAEVVVRDGVAALRNNADATVAGSISGLGSAGMSRIDITANPEARVASVQVSHPTPLYDFRYLNFTNTAHIGIYAGNLRTWGYTSAGPRYEYTQALNVLEELADQTLSAMWIDEHGVLHFVPSAGLRGRASMQTITTANDILALAWSDRLLAVASRIIVAYQDRTFTANNLQRVLVAEGRRHVLGDGDITEDTYKPGSDEDWYGVDDDPTRLPPWGQEFNVGSGSFVGVTYYVGEDLAAENLPARVQITMTKTGISEWSIKHEAQHFTDGVTAETISHPETTTLWQRRRGTALPQIKAWAKIDWTEREVTQTTGQPGPVLRVDLGAQAVVEKAEEVRAYLHELVTNAVPQITDLEVTPDPRRQLGDIITIQSRNFLGVTLTCLVTGMSESMSADGATQALSLDVLDVTVGAVTWEQWEQAFPGTLTYNQWETLRDATDTYNDFLTDPLKGAH